MTDNKPAGRRMADVDRDRIHSAKRRADYVDSLARQEQAEQAAKGEAAARALVEAYREAKPVPPGARQAPVEHSGYAVDERLGAYRKGRASVPAVALAPPQDLGGPPIDWREKQAQEQAREQAQEQAREQAQEQAQRESS